MTEKQIEAKMCLMIKNRGGLALKFVSPNSPGVPDRIVITPSGEIWFVELKTLIGRLAPMQRFQTSELQKRNARVRVIHGWEAARAFVDEIIPAKEAKQ